MTQANKAPLLAEAESYLHQLDLGYVRNKMCSSHYPLPRWPEALALKCEQLYKRFLLLLLKHPREPLVPTRDMDEFWHNHILFTKNYTQDCLALYGCYMHHTPSDPDNQDEISALVPHYQRTKILYEAEFKEPLLVLERCP